MCVCVCVWLWHVRSPTSILLPLRLRSGELQTPRERTASSSSDSRPVALATVAGVARDRLLWVLGESARRRFCARDHGEVGEADLAFDSAKDLAEQLVDMLNVGRVAAALKLALAACVRARLAGARPVRPGRVARCRWRPLASLRSAI